MATPDNTTADRSSHEDGGSMSIRATNHKRSSNVFENLGRNFNLMTASDLTLVVTHVLEIHRDSRADFVYVIKVTYQNSKWEIQKRYSDLQFFCERMREANLRIKSSMKEFPAKVVGKNSFNNASAKIPELNAWLAGFVGSSAGSRFPPGSTEEQQLFSFIELFLHQPTPKDRMGRTFPDRVLHMGYLRKLGGNKSGGGGNWKRRYVVLQRDLQYFEDEDAFRNGGLPKGVIKLNAFCVEKKSEGLLNEFVVHSMPYPLVCRAASPEDMDGWVEALEHVGHGVRSNIARCSGSSTGHVGKQKQHDEEEIQWAA